MTNTQESFQKLTKKSKRLDTEEAAMQHTTKHSKRNSYNNRRDLKRSWEQD